MNARLALPCIVCGTETRPGASSWHARCPSCNYESSTLSPTINETQAHALVDESEREAALKSIRLENFRTIVDQARALAGANARALLDVGCAHGWFLETARAKFDVLGLEPDATVGAMAAGKGLPVRAGYFPDALKPGESFDIIVFNDVIEHIPDIETALAECHARLNRDGLLILNLPNSRGFFYRVSKVMAKIGLGGPFERMWQKGMPSPHVHYFDPANLNQLVGRFGFARVHQSELPALHAHGLLERLRYVGKVNPVVLYAQYAAIMCLLPVLRAFPSDITMGIFRKA